MSSYTLTINGIDRTTSVQNGTIRISDSIGSSASTLSFQITNRVNTTPPIPDQEVIIIQDGVRLFGGRILKVSPVKLGSFLLWNVECVDYTRDLDRTLVVEAYQGMSDREIIVDIVDNYCGGTGISYDNVTEGITISNITFNYMPPSECFTKICNLTGREWYIDYNKDIHYMLKSNEHSPFNIGQET